jgi:hypothetical protein
LGPVAVSGKTAVASSPPADDSAVLAVVSGSAGHIRIRRVLREVVQNTNRIHATGQEAGVDEIHGVY